MTTAAVPTLRSDPSFDPWRTADDLDQLGARIVGLSARIAAATCRWLLLVAEFDSREGYARWGLASTAQWLAHSCGIAHRTAVEHVRVARSLTAFPTLAGALEAGRISYSHTRAISRLAHTGEQRLVDDLIGVAEHGSVGQLETVVRGLRTVEDTTADTEVGAGSAVERGGRDSGEYVRHGWASRTSHWLLSTRLDPERGALVSDALAQLAAAEQLSPADALVRIAEIALAALNRRAEGPPRGLRGHERAAVLIHLDATVRPADEAEAVEAVPRSRERGTAAAATGPARADLNGRPGRPFARIAGGPGLPRPVVERLLCACRIRVAVLDGTPTDLAPNVLDLGRTRRLVDDRLFRALLIRDRRCAHPGCTSRHNLEAHHVIHWLHGGRTDMANLVLLCSRHHHTHHDGAFTVERVGSRRRGRFVFRRPDGSVLEPHIDPSAHVEADAPALEAEYAHLPDTAMLSRSIGDRLDRDWAVAVLADRREARRPPPAA